MATYRLETFTVRLEVGESPRANYKLKSSEDVWRLARSVYATLDADKEHFVLFCLNNKHRLNGFKVVSTGSLTASLVHPREVYRAALGLCAAAVVFVHNHPSGEPGPSPEDNELTRRLKEGGELLGIKVLDHVIVGENSFFSFSDRGLI